MKQSNHKFKLKTWYFVLGVILFFSFTNIVSKIKIEQMPLAAESTNLTELSEIKFDNTDINIVLFYDNNLDICSKMRFSLEKLAESPQETLHFFAIDVAKHPKPFYEYNVSGIPNILIFKGNKEIKRIMGIVPMENLEKIIGKIK